MAMAASPGEELQLMLQFHVVFAVLAAAVLAPFVLAPTPGTGTAAATVALTSGQAVGALVLLYSASFGVLSYRCHANLHAKFTFAAVLSVFQVVPDLFLDAVLGTLTFPPDGSPLLFGQ